MLIRYLPHDAALVTEINDGIPAWSPTDHLLADLWAVTVRAHTADKKGAPVDHPVRVEMGNRAKVKAKKTLRAIFLQRKKKYGGE